MSDAFDTALSELAVQHGQAFFCDPLEDEPPCADCDALFRKLRQAAVNTIEQRHAALVAALEGLRSEIRDKAILVRHGNYGNERAIATLMDSWDVRLNDLLRQHAGGLAPIAPEETP